MFLSHIRIDSLGAASPRLLQIMIVGTDQVGDSLRTAAVDDLDTSDLKFRVPFYITNGIYYLVLVA
jgi:hypothetical protein